LKGKEYGEEINRLLTLCLLQRKFLVLSETDTNSDPALTLTTKSLKPINSILVSGCHKKYPIVFTLQCILPVLRS
jgi:hypothetical protein